MGVTIHIGGISLSKIPAFPLYQKSKKNTIEVKMAKTNKSLLIIRWTARITALFFILTMLLIFFGSIFSTEESKPTGVAWIGILFMPIGVVVGLILAWKREGLGSIVTLLSLVCFHLYLVIQSGTFRLVPFADLIIVPAILFLAYWYLTRSTEE